jgi:hypothetical protein
LLIFWHVLVVTMNGIFHNGISAILSSVFLPHMNSYIFTARGLPRFLRLYVAFFLQWSLPLHCNFFWGVDPWFEVVSCSYRARFKLMCH